MNKYKKYGIPLFSLLLGLLIGWLIFSNEGSHNNEGKSRAESTNTIWTCSMHPQIRSSEEGQCPICGMDLIPVGSASQDSSMSGISMSPTAMQLANVQTAIVGKSAPSSTLELSGRIVRDESRDVTQTTHISGRIEKLLVNTTGEEIQQGQILAYLYSPELVTAQDELLEAYKMRNELPALFEAAKNKLSNWKLSSAQIQRILQNQKVIERFPITADVSGVVTEKKVNLGDYIKVGQVMFEVADLSTVWAEFDVYERNLQMVSEGDSIFFNVQSLPGVTFKGSVDFIDPIINNQDRVAKARVVVPNESGRLKPDMFLRGKLKNITSDNGEKIVIPKSAVLWTGKRSVVYVKDKTNQMVSFKFREVVLGPAYGDEYVIEEGLEPGEEIAVSGAFNIDAVAQLAGKPSMMNPHGSSNSENGKTLPKLSQELKGKLVQITKSYLNLKDDLVNDDFKKALESGERLNTKLKDIEMSDFKDESHNIWMSYSPKLKTNLNELLASKHIEEARNYFVKISDAIIQLQKQFSPVADSLYIQHCPMGNNDKGADWLSTEQEVLNPYFGEAMLKCGSVIEVIQ